MPLASFHARLRCARITRRAHRVQAAQAVESAIEKLIERRQAAAGGVAVGDGRALSQQNVDLVDELNQHRVDHRGHCRTCRDVWGAPVAAPCVPLSELVATLAGDHHATAGAAA